MSGEPRKKKILAQSSDSMGERNLAILASKQSELDFTVVDLYYRGYLAGLDEYFYQVCLSSDGSLILVNREQTLSIVTTGKRLSDFQGATVDSIKKKIASFTQVCSSFLES